MTVSPFVSQSVLAEKSRFSHGACLGHESMARPVEATCFEASNAPPGGVGIAYERNFNYVTAHATFMARCGSGHSSSCVCRDCLIGTQPLARSW
jgi:hypothetical protein